MIITETEKKELREFIRTTVLEVLAEFTSFYDKVFKSANL